MLRKKVKGSHAYVSRMSECSPLGELFCVFLRSNINDEYELIERTRKEKGNLKSLLHHKRDKKFCEASLRIIPRSEKESFEIINAIVLFIKSEMLLFTIAFIVDGFRWGTSMEKQFRSVMKSHWSPCCYRKGNRLFFYDVIFW